jgi:hypothetical protein
MSNSAKFIYASKEFVNWAHERLSYNNIRDTLSALDKADKVWLGRLYLAWQNKESIPEDLYKRLKYTPPAVPACFVCTRILSRSEVWNCVHDKSGKYKNHGETVWRCSEHINAQAVQNNSDPAQNVLPKPMSFSEYARAEYQKRLESQDNNYLVPELKHRTVKQFREEQKNVDDIPLELPEEDSDEDSTDDKPPTVINTDTKINSLIQCTWCRRQCTVEDIQKLGRNMCFDCKAKEDVKSEEDANKPYVRPNVKFSTSEY